MFSKKRLSILFCFFLLSLIVCIFYRPIFEWCGIIGFLDRPLTSLQVHAADYIYANQLSNFQQSHVSPSNADQKTIINFRFKVNTISGANNIFQTAPGNAGIRVELTHNNLPTIPALFLPFSAKESDALGNTLTLIISAEENNKFLTATIDDDLSLKKWHTLKIAAWNHHSITVWLDGSQAQKIDDPSINYQISDIQIGRGFDNTRIFYGQISHFTLKNTVFNLLHRKHVNQTTNLLAILCGALASITFIFISQKPMSRGFKLSYIAFGILLGFFIAVSFHYIIAFYYGASYPSNTFLYYAPTEAFKDFYDQIKNNMQFDPYFAHLFFVEGYPPFCFLLMRIFNFFTLHLALIAYYLIFLSAYSFFIRHYFTNFPKNIAEQLNNYILLFILGFMSYPFLFTFERGNIELILFILLTAFLFFYEKKQIYLAATFLSMAIAMKIYPVAFIILFISIKHYKAIFFSLLVTCFLELVSLLLFKHSIAENIHRFNSAFFHISNYCQAPYYYCAKYNIGIWGWMESLSNHLFFINHFSIYNFKIYFLVSIIIFGLLAAYVIFIETEQWKKIALLSFSMLLLPVWSHDYKLLHIYLPLFFFVSHKPEKFDLLYATLFIILLIPKNYYVLASSQVGLNSTINPPLILLFSTAIIIHGFYQKYIPTKKNNL